MPHSGGGGSSGGGFHSGSSGSSSRTSTHYFPGARRYVRHYSDGRPDDYIYANSKPGKTTLSSIVIVIVMGLIFIAASGFAAVSERARFITPVYSDDPAIHDTVGVLEDKDELLELMKKYNKLTGICPVIYTVFDEEWNREYTNLEKYSYDKYVSNFSDEQHYLIVYSIPAKSAEFHPGGVVTSSEFKWESMLGDDTDRILTESVANKIGRTIQNALNAGKGPGKAFISGFEVAIASAQTKLNPSPVRAIVNTITSSAPLLICLAIFIPLLIIMFKSYKKDLAMTIEEVPLDVDPVAVPGMKTYVNANGGTVTEYTSQNYYSRYTGHNTSNPAAGKVINIVSLIVIIPFVLIGIGVITGGVAMLSSGNDRTGGIFMLFFGVVWTFISVASLIGILKATANAKKNMSDPLTAEYPKAEYPDMKPVTPASKPSQPAEQPEFDPQFFGSAKSDYESDDEDYKRMKRRGFE